jgi:hypothetical protein
MCGIFQTPPTNPKPTTSLSHNRVPISIKNYSGVLGSAFFVNPGKTLGFKKSSLNSKPRSEVVKIPTSEPHTHLRSLPSPIPDVDHRWNCSKVALVSATHDSAAKTCTSQCGSRICDSQDCVVVKPAQCMVTHILDSDELMNETRMHD